MPKIKSHKGAAKRFKFTKSGKIKRQKEGRRHHLQQKSNSRKRKLRNTAYLEDTAEKNMKKLLPYG